MAIRIVQRNNRPTPQTDVVIIYHLTSQLDDKVKAAYPDAVILNETYPPGGHYGGVGPDKVTPLSNCLEIAGLKPEDVRNLILVGFSEGCQAPRSLLLAGASPSAILAVDGIHNNLTDKPGGQTLNYHVAPWKNYAALARDSEKVFTITHSAIVPMVKRPDGSIGHFASTTQMAAIILSPDTEKNPPVMAGADGKYVQTGFFEQGLFRVVGYSGGDAPAHVFQAMTILPSELSRIRGILATKSIPFQLGGSKMIVDSTPFNGTIPPVTPASVPSTPGPTTPNKPKPKPSPPSAPPEGERPMSTGKAVMIAGAGCLLGWWLVKD